MKLRHLCLIAAIACFVQISAAEPANAPSPLEKLKTAIPALEGALRNAYVESVCVNEDWDASKAVWKDAGGSELTAWYDGKPKGSVRLDFSRDRHVWIGGAAPFSEDRWSITYNGIYGQQRYTLFDQKGKPAEPMHGDLLVERPTMLMADGNYASAWQLTIWGCREQRSAPISNLFNAKTSGAFPFTADEVDFNKIPCIRATFKAFNQIETWYFDPQHGYVLRGYEVTQAGRPIMRYTIDEIMEAAPDLYYPKHAVREYFQPATGAPWFRSTITVSKAVINDPAFDYFIFDYKWKAGSSVYEGRTKSRLKMTGDFKEDNATLLATAKKAAGVPATRPGE